MAKARTRRAVLPPKGFCLSSRSELGVMRRVMALIVVMMPEEWARSQAGIPSLKLAPTWDGFRDGAWDIIYW